jgi:CRISPR system Cascade subunit CasE
VLVQSELEPDWVRLPAEYLARPAEHKPFDLAVTAGQRLRFRLRANPTRRVSEKDARLGSVMAGKRVGLITEADQVRWLLRKADAGGFVIPGGWVHPPSRETGEPVMVPNFRVDVVPEGRDRNSKPGRAGAFIAVRFDGVLEVTDPGRFRQTVCAGIGSGKGFGFGLFSVAAVGG